MSDDIRKKIVSATRKRMAHYGYSKTSMNEIAADCDMSVGNLYRFYKNKEAIAVAGAEICFREKAELSEAAAKGSGTTFEKLHAYLQARLDYMHGFVSETPHMYEMVELISTRHKALLETYEERTIEFISNLIEQGQESHEIKSGDAGRWAADLYRATMLFNMPICMYAPLQERQLQLRCLLETIWHGLANKANT